MANFKLYLTQLPEETQKHVRQCIKMARNFFSLSRQRLDGYQHENAESNTDSVIKTIEDLRQTIAVAEAMLAELVDAHGLPDDLKVVPDDYRKDFAELLAGTFGSEKQ